MEMRRRKMMVVGAMVMVWLLVGAPVGDAAISCGTVSRLVEPCVRYLRGSRHVMAGCCSGLRTLDAQASTTPDRQAACTCMRAVASANSGVLRFHLVDALPAICGLNIPYNITLTTDCTKVR